jgi:hypothetical protein
MIKNTGDGHLMVRGVLKALRVLVLRLEEGDRYLPEQMGPKVGQERNSQV